MLFAQDENKDTNNGFMVSPQMLENSRAFRWALFDRAIMLILSMWSFSSLIAMTTSAMARVWYSTTMISSDCSRWLKSLKLQTPNWTGNVVHPIQWAYTPISSLQNGTGNVVGSLSTSVVSRLLATTFIWVACTTEPINYHRTHRSPFSLTWSCCAWRKLFRKWLPESLRNSEETAKAR